MTEPNSPAVRGPLDATVVPPVAWISPEVLSAMPEYGRAGVCWPQATPSATVPLYSQDQLDVAISSLRSALEWYADEARACSKNSGSARHDAPQALLASVTVLALDGGQRADDAQKRAPPDEKATGVTRFWASLRSTS